MIKINKKLWNSWVGNNSYLYCKPQEIIRWDSKNYCVVLDFTLWYKIGVIVLFPLLFIILIVMFGVKEIKSIMSIPPSLFNGVSKRVEFVSSEHNNRIYELLKNNY